MDTVLSVSLTTKLHKQSKGIFAWKGKLNYVQKGDAFFFNFTDYITVSSNNKANTKYDRTRLVDTCFYLFSTGNCLGG